MGRWVVFDKSTDATVDLSRSWTGITPWSAENPALYTLVLRLRKRAAAQQCRDEKTQGKSL
jgi:beta-galactosidase/beta-glucuronidase